MRDELSSRCLFRRGPASFSPREAGPHFQGKVGTRMREKEMTRNEAAERLRETLTARASWLDEALATERRLTVERVREVLRQQGYTALVALFDDLATADVDEEAGNG